MPIDVNLVDNDAAGNRAYSLGFRIVQSGAAAADVSVLAMRNTGTRNIKLTGAEVEMYYGNAAGASSSIKGYYLQRFTTATPSGGTAITPAQHSSGSPAASVDARFLDTGLTTTNLVFGSVITYYLRDTGYSATTHIDNDWSGAPIILAPGEGVILRVATTALETIFGIGGTIQFYEE
jgi:hypothetical protein